MNEERKREIVEQYFKDRQQAVISEELLRTYWDAMNKVNKFQHSTLWERIKYALRGDIS